MGCVIWFITLCRASPAWRRCDALQAFSRSEGDRMHTLSYLSMQITGSKGERDGMGRTTLNLDTRLVAEAKQALGARSQTEAIHMALAHVVRQQRLDALAGRTFPDLTPDLLARLRGRTEADAARPE